MPSQFHPHTQVSTAHEAVFETLSLLDMYCYSLRQPLVWNITILVHLKNHNYNLQLQLQSKMQLNLI